MPFRKVDQAVPNFPKLEREILDLWRSREVFRRSLEDTEGKPEFVFYEGPPTANGLPHNGHVLTRVVKDLFPRYKTMRGYHVERRAGWDTHGLPVEVEVEKELRISGRSGILSYGVDRFARKCIESIFRYTAEWEHLTERVGYWVDLSQAYVTYHKAYVESVWWALSKLFEKKLLYQGHKVVWWWAQGGTALSAGEVGGSYKTVDDPSVYVRFPLVDEHASLVVWTTTPWTLPSNMFVGVHGEFDYVFAKDQESGEVLVIAHALLGELTEKTERNFTIEKTVKGHELIDQRYRPPFDTFSRGMGAEDTGYWRVIAGDRSTTNHTDWFVTLDSGTGLVHLAPAFGEDDWKAWRRHVTKHGHLDILCAVKPDGTFDERMAELNLEGVWVKDGDRPLVKALEASGHLVHLENYRHEYPFAPRAENDPLIQYARSAWFIRTTEKIDSVLGNNQAIAWMPEHIRDGRMGDFLEGNVDWALSRERFWGTPLNIWVCDDCESMEAPASCAEIEERQPDAFVAFRAAKEKDPTLSEDLMVHKPWIDKVTLPCSSCAGTMRRVPDVIDCWFDSGCMPFAQLGYPHQPRSKEAFARSFPADFISEAIDQTRGWFYSLMMVSNLVFEDRSHPHPYRRCIVLGHVLDKAGKKESKSSGNYTPPEVILDAVRMEFAPIALTAKPAKGAKLPKPGVVLIGRDDLDGLDLREGNTVSLYRLSAGESKLTVKLKVHKNLSRRVLILSEEDRTALGLVYAPDGVMPREVPLLPEDQRVVIEAEGLPAPGADAFRWFFYAANPPWNSTRHSLANVRTQQKELPIKLRNVFAFFMTYANIDGFDPVTCEGARSKPGHRPLLDRWILSELEQTKLEVVEHMDAFRSYEATQVLSDFVDGLSNWYVRRSRDRFWAEGQTNDKLDAYWTLYQCLRDLTLLLAPFTPFAAEDMYQALVVEPYGEAMPDSVHLRSYPGGDASQVDAGLSRDMAEVRELVSLGLQVRASCKIKTRQPLEAAEIVLSNPERKDRLMQYIPMMADELNVKSFIFRERADELVTYAIKPNFRALGTRLGARMKAVAAALAKVDASAVLVDLETFDRFVIEVEGDAIELSKGDVVVQVEAKDGFAAASGPVGVVVLRIQLNDSLIAEGRCREVLSKIQAHRKHLHLDFDDRIRLQLSGDPGILEVCRANEAFLMKETLATEIAVGGPVLAEATEVSVDGFPLHIHVVKAS
ncbi:MAG: isoleucine--tRNA ligase [Myxococcales bacterium]|nr:isoleucine--tRNA ligase [Myxococcales bacterium]